MPRSRYTLADLITRLDERVGNNLTFWKKPEKRDAINEAISFWQALTGEWTTQIAIEAKSPSPSFYPVPKQIVSLTRVGIASEEEAFNPLGGHILPNWPVYKTGPSQNTSEFYHTVTDRPINWTFKPTGGLAPYRIVWNFGMGDLPEREGLEITNTFDISQNPGLVNVSARVTDVTGDTITVLFPVNIANHTVDSNLSDPIEFTPGESFSFQFEMWYLVNGDQFTEPFGNRWANRFPIHFEVDFQPFDTGDPADLGHLLVKKVELLDANNTVRDSRTLPASLKFNFTVENFWKFSDGYRPALSAFDGETAEGYGGQYQATQMKQEITDYAYDVAPVDGFPEAGSVRITLQSPEEAFTADGGNFRVRITDGTGLTVERLFVYTFEGL